MSTYVISDIHGCNSKFRKALKSVHLRKTDTLILLGDLIDRGDDSKGVLDTIFLLKEHDFNIISVLGNHEDLLIKSLTDFKSEVSWLKNGGNKTLESFSTSEIQRIPKKYIDYIRGMEPYYILNDYIFSHAGVNMLADKPLEDIHSLLWLRNWKNYYDSNWLKGRKVIHGHTPMKTKDIEDQKNLSENVYCIDNGAFMKKEGYGNICILKLEDMSFKFVGDENN